MQSKVDDFLKNAVLWNKEMEALRKIVLSCNLDEDFKWNKPCYSLDGKNVLIIQGFKNYCAILFFKGALLKNSDGLLVKTGANTQVGRQARFVSVSEITKHRRALITCIKEAIDVEKSGVKPKVSSDSISIPAELNTKMKNDPAFKKAFQKLTPGKQRGYIYYFSQAKQSATRTTRIEKYVPKILKGLGMLD